MIDSILQKLPEYKANLQEIREILLANTIMFGEIQAPTFEEEDRIRFLKDRFNEKGLQNISTDEVGNGMAVLPGKENKACTLIVAHADSPFPRTTQHAISVQKDCMEGPGIADNAVGLAAVASLPIILEKLGISLKNDLILVGSTRSLGRGNLEGIRCFLNNNTLPIRSGICIKGLQLGRLSYSSLGILRGEITCRVPPEYDWTRFSATNAISNLTSIINRIQAIPLPKEPRTSVILGSISGGAGFNILAKKAQLRFELRSEDETMVPKVLSQIEEIVEEAALETRSTISFDVIARADSSSIPYSHPLVRTTREILKKLEVEPFIVPTTGELSALLSKNIPSVTLGLTIGQNLHETNESIQIEPIFTGLTQLIALLQAIDEDCCDE